MSLYHCATTTVYSDPSLVQVCGGLLIVVVVIFFHHYYHNNYYYCLYIYLAIRFQILFRNRSQMTSKCGKTKKVAQPNVSLMFLPHFDVLCPIQINVQGKGVIKISVQQINCLKIMKSLKNKTFQSNLLQWINCFFWNCSSKTFQPKN